MTERADRVARAGIARPINWDDLGASAKDLWEERQMPWVTKTEDAAANAERGENPSYYVQGGITLCIDHDEPIDARYGCRYCPEEVSA